MQFLLKLTLISARQLSCLGPLELLLTKNYELFAPPYFQLCVYLAKVIPERRTLK